MWYDNDQNLYFKALIGALSGIGFGTDLLKLFTRRQASEDKSGEKALSFSLFVGLRWI